MKKQGFFKILGGIIAVKTFDILGFFTIFY